MADTRRASPPWHRDEVILALDLYVRHGCLGGGQLPGKGDDAIIELSQLMNELPIWTSAQRAETFRNPAGVALKLANFRAIERVVALERRSPGAEGLPRGMKRFSVLDRVVFEEYLDRWQELRFEAEAIRWAADSLAPLEVRESTATYLAADASIEGGGAPAYEVATSPGGRRDRAEADLVAEYAAYMVARGHEVVGRHYRSVEESRPLRADMMVRDLNVLVEAKASDARYALRMAVGQLFDYQRYEATDPQLAVLVPREPIRDLTALLDGLSIGCVWPKGSGFADTVDGRLCA
jgi:hypothetical protein